MEQFPSAAPFRDHADVVLGFGFHVDPGMEAWLATFPSNFEIDKVY
jgi:hypothetical protein